MPKKQTLMFLAGLCGVLGPAVLGLHLLTAPPPGASPAVAESRARTDASTRTSVAAVLRPPSEIVHGGLSRTDAPYPVELRVREVEGGRPVRACTLILLAADRASPIRWERVTDEGGQARFELPRGEYIVELSAPGLIPQARHHLRVPTAEPTDLWMEAPLRLAGAVLDAMDRPVPEAVVRLTEAATQCAGHEPNEQQLQRTDRQGRFAFTRCRQAVYTLDASASDRIAQRSTLDLRRGVPESLVVRLDPGGTVRGIVTTGGLPVGGAMVEVTDGSGHAANRTTDPGGAFDLDGLHPGPVMVSCAPPDELPLSTQKRAVEVCSGESVECSFSLTAPSMASIEIRVQSNGMPLEDGLVRLTSVEAGAFLREPEAPGQFRFEDLPAGAFGLEVAVSDGGCLAWLQAQPLTLVPGAYDMEWVDLVLGTISGRVVSRETGEPLPFASVTLERRSDGVWDEVRSGSDGCLETDEGGFYTIALVPRGIYRVALAGANERSAERSASITLLAGEIRDGVDIRLD